MKKYEQLCRAAAENPAAPAATLGRNFLAISSFSKNKYFKYYFLEIFIISALRAVGSKFF